ncbi:hypothetical protein PR048_031833 [Dryococelus australis]|uniref:Uncharacterized protein n=1 Tax=Dryococelus australis TaxID=614101 RepID=A0ABQ9G6D2_9NEOP|nr:hypothetical protein PR048_031833 [Dryococelus australis]
MTEIKMIGNTKYEGLEWHDTAATSREDDMLLNKELSWGRLKRRRCAVLCMSLAVGVDYWVTTAFGFVPSREYIRTAMKKRDECVEEGCTMHKILTKRPKQMSMRKMCKVTPKRTAKPAISKMPVFDNISSSTSSEDETSHKQVPLLEKKDFHSDCPVEESTIGRNEKNPVGESPMETDFTNEMSKMLNMFGTDMSKALLAKNKRLEQFTEAKAKHNGRLFIPGTSQDGSYMVERPHGYTEPLTLTDSTSHITKPLQIVVYAEAVPDVPTLEQHVRVTCDAIRVQATNIRKSGAIHDVTRRRLHCFSWSDEALGVCVRVALIAPSLLDLGHSSRFSPTSQSQLILLEGAQKVLNLEQGQFLLHCLAMLFAGLLRSRVPRWKILEKICYLSTEQETASRIINWRQAGGDIMGDSSPLDKRRGVTHTRWQPFHCSRTFSLDNNDFPKHFFLATYTFCGTRVFKPHKLQCYIMSGKCLEEHFKIATQVGRHIMAVNVVGHWRVVTCSCTNGRDDPCTRRMDVHARCMSRATLVYLSSRAVRATDCSVLEGAFFEQRCRNKFLHANNLRGEKYCPEEWDSTHIALGRSAGQESSMVQEIGPDDVQSQWGKI